MCVRPPCPKCGEFYDACFSHCPKCGEYNEYGFHFEKVSTTESKEKNIRACLHAFLIRQIDRTRPTGGFTGDWECVRCKQRFKTLVARDVPKATFETRHFVNLTAWPYSYSGPEGIDDDQ